jgi:hypothetical protein
VTGFAIAQQIDTSRNLFESQFPPLLEGMGDTHFEVRGKGVKISIVATYDNEGMLVESVLKISDTRIPPAIRQFITSGKFVGWAMVGNEKTVKDFDPFQTEYSIV